CRKRSLPRPCISHHVLCSSGNKAGVIRLVPLKHCSRLSPGIQSCFTKFWRQAHSFSGPSAQGVRILKMTKRSSQASHPMTGKELGQKLLRSIREMKAGKAERTTQVAGSPLTKGLSSNG